MRVGTPSLLGDWSYEVVETKLAQEARVGTILQLCVYSELLGVLQGRAPEHMHVVTPGQLFQPETFRIEDFSAYYRFVKSRLEKAVVGNELFAIYPDPVEQCDVCQWWP